MRYLITTKDQNGNELDRRPVYARDRAHLKALKQEAIQRFAWLGATKATAKINKEEW